MLSLVLPMPVPPGRKIWGHVMRRRIPSFAAILLLTIVTVPPAFADPPMKLVGELIPWGPYAEFGSSVVDAARNVAYMGSLADDHGVAVIDITDRANPVFVNELPPVVFNPPTGLSTSDGLDLVGRYLLVAHHQDGSTGFGGVSVWDISSDPFHPVHLRDIVVAPGCGPESAYLDPEVESGRPYAYVNVHCFGPDQGMHTVNILTGQELSVFVSPEGQVCPPFPCFVENFPHESFVQRHPVSHRMLDYIGFWDSGLRILDVTDPANPTEVGAFDYGPGTQFQNAHGAVATPSGNWTYVGDELATDTTGVIHIFDTHDCDGTTHCTPVLVGFWHVPGHGVQDPGNSFSNFLRFDPHNLRARGENTVLYGNYGLGVRLIDTSDKTNPQEISFYQPDGSANGTQQRPGFYGPGPRTWVARFGSDGLVYASDINYGFFTLQLNPLTVLPQGAARLINVGSGSGGTSDLLPRVATTEAGGHSVTFTTRRQGPVSLSIFNAAGQRVAIVNASLASGGTYTLTWDGRNAAGPRSPSGVYFARLATSEGSASMKLVHLAP